MKCTCRTVVGVVALTICAMMVVCVAPLKHQRISPAPLRDKPLATTASAVAEMARLQPANLALPPSDGTVRCPIGCFHGTGCTNDTDVSSATCKVNPSEAPHAWLRRLCSTVSSNNSTSPSEVSLGWGTTAVNRVVCTRGRRIFRDYADTAVLSTWAMKRLHVPLFNLTDTNVAFPSLQRYYHHTMQPPLMSYPSLPRERP